VMYRETVTLGFNKFAFHWFFPEIVAVNEGLFEENNIFCRLVELGREGWADKSDLYITAMRTGLTDLYHCGEWVGVIRVLKGTAGKIAAKSRPAPETLNASFTIFVNGESPIHSPEELVGKPVAVEAGTGSYYAARADLERYLRPEEIKLFSISEPHERFKALARGDVAAASLLGPWAKLAIKNGYRPILTTRRENPTLLILADRLSDDVASRLVKTLNEAINRINNDPWRYNDLYFRYLREAASAGGVDEKWLKSIESELLVDRWSIWEPYAYRELVDVARWMLERNLISKIPEPDSVRTSFWGLAGQL
jgi:ABC-type nitrate/sulfonate/bicarbonate transport system substrate-binding protein